MTESYVYRPPPTVIRNECKSRLAEVLSFHPFRYVELIRRFQLLIWVSEAPDHVVFALRPEIMDLHNRYSSQLKTSLHSAAVASEEQVRTSTKRTFVEYPESAARKTPRITKGRDHVPGKALVRRHGRVVCSRVLFNHAEKLPWMLQPTGFPSHVPLPPLPSPKTFLGERGVVAAKPQADAARGAPVKKELV